MKFNKYLTGLIAALSLMFGVAYSGRAQVVPTTIIGATNVPTLVTSLAISNTFPCIITLHKNQGLGLTWNFTCAGSGTSNAMALLYPSVDATNYDVTPWQFGRAANGATTVTATTNFSFTFLQGYQTVKVVLTNANSATLTNAGLQFNLP
jgi:hypothetical protein